MKALIEKPAAVKARLRKHSCWNCGEQPGTDDPFTRIEIDHIIPVAQGGSDTEDNWQPLCGRCNRHKTVMTNDEARRARTLPTFEGTIESWPRGFNWSEEQWDDGSEVGWVFGQIFTYPIRTVRTSVRIVQYQN